MICKIVIKYLSLLIGCSIFLMSFAGCSQKSDEKKEAINSITDSKFEWKDQLPEQGKVLTQEDVSLTDEKNVLFPESVVSQGDASRVANVMKKARNGEDITIGFIGGSITMGSSTTRSEYRYADRVVQWWKDKYPNIKIRTINAGIGATDSILGAHRVQKQLLVYEPDFVVVEFAVNDPNSELAGRTYEGLVRQILQSKNTPGLMLLFMMSEKGANVQEIHQKVGEHYALPMISYRDALWPAVEKGYIEWKDIMADFVHPNNNGHFLTAKFVTDYLEAVYNNLDDSIVKYAIAEVNSPLYTDLYTNTQLLKSDDIQPVSLGGWEPGLTYLFTPGWVAKEKNKPMIFELEGSSLGIVYKKFNTSNMGKVEVKVDDRPPVILDGYYEVVNQGYAHSVIVAEDLSPGKHRMEITFLEEHNPNSTGEVFELSALLVAK